MIYFSANIIHRGTYFLFNLLTEISNHSCDTCCNTPLEFVCQIVQRAESLYFGHDLETCSQLIVLKNIDWYFCACKYFLEGYTEVAPKTFWRSNLGIIEQLLQIAHCRITTMLKMYKLLPKWILFFFFLSLRCYSNGQSTYPPDMHDCGKSF